jgi:EAL domain-containing protein (putative c-di-GMP-specific phosphodiesterase class I)
VSIGIGCFPQDGADSETLSRNADTAMYRAKAEGRNTYQFFSEEMNARALENLRLGNEMRVGLDRGEFILHYQPRVDVVSGEVTGAEALVRWQHPQRGLVLPGRFIPLAEESGLIEPLGEWVLRAACRQMRQWRKEGLPLARMAVNLSARQFRRPDLPQLVAAILAETGLAAGHLELEVTESMVMRKPEEAAAVLAKLKAMGIAIAIDDFGTGYSSLSYLKRFPLDYLKIDQSFIRGVPSDIEDAVIVRTIIGMAKSLKLRLIAEGVESADQRRFLLQQGCDEAQGYLFSRPVPAAELEEYLRKTPTAPRLVGVG